MNASLRSSLSKRQAVLGIFAMLVWQVLWHAWLAPPVSMPVTIAVLLAITPIMPAAVLALFRRPSAVFWGGVASLLYFSHAIAEWHAMPDIWPLALVELWLSLWIIFTGNWNGLKAKLFKRAGGTPAQTNDATERP